MIKNNADRIETTYKSLGLEILYNSVCLYVLWANTGIVHDTHIKYWNRVLLNPLIRIGEMREFYVTLTQNAEIGNFDIPQEGQVNWC